MLDAPLGIENSILAAVNMYSIDMNEVVDIDGFLKIISQDDSFKHSFQEFPAQSVRAWWSLYRTWVDISDDYYQKVDVKETDHKKVNTEINGVICEVDEEILPLVLFFNKIGVPTLYSCQGSEKNSAYISFDYVEGFFDNMVEEINIFNRIIGNSVNIMEEKSIGEHSLRTDPISTEVKIRTSIYFKNIQAMKTFTNYMFENHKSLTF